MGCQTVSSSRIVKNLEENEFARRLVIFFSLHVLFFSSLRRAPTRLRPCHLIVSVLRTHVKRWRTKHTMKKRKNVSLWCYCMQWHHVSIVFINRSIPRSIKTTIYWKYSFISIYLFIAHKTSIGNCCVHNIKLCLSSCSIPKSFFFIVSCSVTHQREYTNPGCVTGKQSRLSLSLFLAFPSITLIERMGAIYPSF